MELVIDHMLVLYGVELSVGCHVTIETTENIRFSMVLNEFVLVRISFMMWIDDFYLNSLQ